jgi:hypothetical protein
LQDEHEEYEMKARKEYLVAYFMALFQHNIGEAEENQIYSNLVPP